MAVNTPSLKTERLSLNNISLDDADSIVFWRSDPEVYRFFLTPKPTLKENHIKWFNDSYLKDDNRCDWMAFDADNNRIGVFGIKRENQSATTAELSYILSPTQKGKGYAREAILKLMEYAASEWKAKKVIAEIHFENKASIHFAEKLGMSLESKEGDFYTYSMTV